MKYKCIPCGDEFEFDGKGKPRCPKCLGIHDIEKVSKPSAKESSSRGWVAPTVVLVVALIVAVLYFTLKDTDSVDLESEAVLEKVAQDALGELDLPGGKDAMPFSVTDEITAFAKESADGDDGEEALQHFFDTIAKKKTEGYFKPYDQREPRSGEVLTAKALLAKLTKKDERPFEALSYELSALMLAMAKSIGEDAQMVEISYFQGTKKPADPGGKHGRFGVSMKGEGSKIYDPYGGLVVVAKDVKTFAMGDKEAMAPFYALKSLSLLIDQKSSEAVKLNEVGIKLDPNNPYLRACRGFIFTASGAPGEAIAEFEKAVKLRDNAVFRINLAELLLLNDPTGKMAETEIQLAIKEMPNYSRAHALLAMVLLMQRQIDQAEQELTLAESLDPSSPTVAMFWAQFHLAKGSSVSAIEKAEQAARLSGHNLTTMLGLAQIYRQTARFDEMRTTLDKVLADTDSKMVAEQIKEIFQYDPEVVEEEPVPAQGSDFKLQLGGSKSPLGSGGPKLGDGLGNGLQLNNGSSGQGLNLELDLNKKE